MLTSIAALVVPLVLQTTEAGAALMREDREKLADCILMLESDPAGAYEFGLAWLGEGNRPEARHCTALALIELGRFDEGAARLEALATATDGGSVAERAHLFAQAGNSWLLAKRPEAALTALNEAKKLNAKDSDILWARARAHLALEDWAAAEDDLTASLSARSNNVEALKLRARARIAQNNLSGAYQDVRIAMELDPSDIEVLVLRGEVREAQRVSR